MCVGFTNGYKDFHPTDYKTALKALVQGSAVSFSRTGIYHFAIFLGFAWPKDGSSEEPIPLVCHLSGDAKTEPKASVRLDNFLDIVQGSYTRVYECSCSDLKRAQVISECLRRVGETGYNPFTNNCEHFVRHVIDGRSASYQVLWTFIAPVVQLPRVLIGITSMSSTASSSSPSRLMCLSPSSLGLFDPTKNLLQIGLIPGGLEISVQKNPGCCTAEFTGKRGLALQELHHCCTCGIAGTTYLCRHCVRMFHWTCETRVVGGDVRGVCSGSGHRERFPIMQPVKQLPNRFKTLVGRFIFFATSLLLLLISVLLLSTYI